MSQSRNESSLIPYEATELTAARILVLAAHPDDETLGAGGALARSAARADAVRVWIATDGSKQERIESETEGSYAGRRRDEAARACEILGVSPPEFGSLPDRELESRWREVQAAISELLTDFQPELVFCPSPVEIHPDHRALADAIYGLLAASRPTDPDHDLFRFLRVAFYEVSHPLLPNALVDISETSERKNEALAAYASQQAVRDYAGAVAGLNAYRRLTLERGGPVEAFRMVDYSEASTRSLEEFRRSIGPAIIAPGERGAAPIAVVVRTRNRPALLREALDSLRDQTARPEHVIVFNDGGASVESITGSYRDAFRVTLEEAPHRRGRAAAANAGVGAADRELLAFLDDDDRCYPDHFERLLRAHRSGPEPVVYSDAVTVVYRRRGEQWEERQRSLQYSLDYDPDYLLLANYIPLHALLFSLPLYGKAGGFDERLDYSEDWDFLIRLSRQTSFRHVRAVTCEYRAFEESEGDPAHAASGGQQFQQARRAIYERYAALRTEAGLARLVDGLRRQIAFWYERDGISQGELRYQRESHRRLDAAVREAERRAEQAQADAQRIAAERSRESEELRGRLAEIEAICRGQEHELSRARGERDRLSAILDEIYSSRTWKLHLFLDRVRGRR